MNRLFLALLSGTLVTAGLGMAPAQSIHLPFVRQSEYWAVPSGPPEVQSAPQIIKPQAISPEYAEEFQRLLERLEAAAKQQYRVTYGPHVPGIRIIIDADDSPDHRAE